MRPRALSHLGLARAAADPTPGYETPAAGPAADAVAAAPVCPPGRAAVARVGTVVPLPGAAFEAHPDHDRPPATEEAAMTVTSTAVDFDTIKSRQQMTRSSGDYAVIGTTLQITGEWLCEAVDVSAGERVLDVAAGN